MSLKFESLGKLQRKWCGFSLFIDSTDFVSDSISFLLWIPVKISVLFSNFLVFSAHTSLVFLLLLKTDRPVKMTSTVLIPFGANRTWGRNKSEFKIFISHPVPMRSPQAVCVPQQRSLVLVRTSHASQLQILSSEFQQPPLSLKSSGLRVNYPLGFSCHPSF